MTNYSLEVRADGVRVGTLGYDSLDERFWFDYDALWRDASFAYSLSPHIRLDGAPASSSTVRRFLENLLPEGRALDVVATTHRLARSNLYGLVRELGQETAGALSFAVAGAAGAPLTTRREVSLAELKARIAARAHVPFAVWDGRVRMSIAGYQDKLAVYREDDRLYLVEGALASTHILKPEPADPRLPMLVANEHFSMCLAGRLGLRVAPVSILRLPAPVLVVERFDRVRADERVRRLHVVDGCQALNLPVSYKYERNFGSGRDVRGIRDGASFERLFGLARDALQPAATQRDLLRWALFQYLIGNADAHGKNLSFFCEPAGLVLAPCYDIVSVARYSGVDQELAMAFGDEFELAAVRPVDWAEFAHRTGTARALLAREMRRLGRDAVQAARRQAADSVYLAQERAFVDAIAAFVEVQAGRLIDMSSAMLRVAPIT